MNTRMRLSVVVASFATAAGALLAVQAGAAPAKYTTLDEAASQPIGIGSRGPAPEQRSGRPKTLPNKVFKDSGAARGGCNNAYGRSGQCLPKVPPSQAAHVAAGHMKPTWDCKEVRLLFKDGLPVTKAKVDPAKLDKNKDGTACGSGD